MTDWLTPQVQQMVLDHMNDDHADQALLICRRLAGADAATAARTIGVTAAEIVFEVTEPTGIRTVAIPFAHQLTDRAQIRSEVVRLHELATRTDL